ncbi:MAG TPA: hypothetical protein VGG74_00135 [Kofleriaceae bacterium]
MVSFHATAHAQSAEAEALFRDGRTLIKQGQLAPGCDKLAASDRLEPSIGTLLNLGDCREKQGKLASAWGAFRRAEAMAERAGNDARRRAEASRRAVALEPKLSTLRIDVDRRIEGLVVHRDDEVVDAAVWSTPVPIDPGTYALRADAPGYTEWQLRVVVGANADHKVAQVPALERAPVAPVAAVAPPAVPIADAAVPVQPTYMTAHRGRTWSATRGVSLGLGIVALGAVGTGAYFGVESKNLQDRADQRCPLPVCADPQGLSDNAQARTDATRANIMYGVAGASAVASVVLWFVGAPSDEMISPMVGDHQAGVSFAGRF